MELYTPPPPITRYTFPIVPPRLFIVEEATVALVGVEVEEEGEVHLHHAVEVLWLSHLHQVDQVQARCAVNHFSTHCIISTKKQI